MKLYSFLFIFASVIGLVYCDGETNYELTYYGQKGEEHTKQDPSCPQYDDDNLPTYFAALGTSLSHYKDYCDNYAVFMSSDGSNVKTIAKAMIVDSCSECGSYHLDVSLNIFTKIVERSKGEARIIWGVYSKKGEERGGPWYDSVSGTAKKLGLDKSAFISAFRANAKKLAASSHYYADFSTSGISFRDDDVKKTTTRKTTTTVKKNTTIARPKNVVTTKQPFPLAPKNTSTTTKQPFPFGSKVTQTTTAIAKQVTGLKTVPAATKAVETPVSKPTSEPVSNIVVEKDDDSGNVVGSTLGIIGGLGAAAGVGLIMMKKKSPSTYEGMKQKFPEAFTTVKRGLTRSATSIKRRVTKREVRQPVAAMV